MYKILPASYYFPHIKQMVSKDSAAFLFFFYLRISDTISDIGGVKAETHWENLFLVEMSAELLPNAYSRHSQWVDVSQQNFGV